MVSLADVSSQVSDSDKKLLEALEARLAAAETAAASSTSEPKNAKPSTKTEIPKASAPKKGGCVVA